MGRDELMLERESENIVPGFDPGHRIFCHEQFAASVGVVDHAIDLGSAALWMGAEEYPGLEVNHCLDQFERLAQIVRGRLEEEADLTESLEALRSVLVEDEGFHGNADDFYDPRNSFLNEVLERRVGIPISLAVLYMEVATRAGLKMSGIGMPGHFLVQLDRGDASVLLDPFTDATVLTKSDCADRLQRLYGEDMELSAGHLAPVGPRRILVRMLKNLRSIYLEARDYARALSVLERIALVVGETRELRCQRGLLYAHLQLYGNAWADLEAGLSPEEDPFPEAYGVDGLLADEDAAVQRHLEYVRFLAGGPN